MKPTTRRIVLCAVCLLVALSGRPVRGQQAGADGAAGRYPLFEVSGPMPETLPPLYLLETPRDTLHELLRRMRTARRDRSVEGIILRIETPAIGWGKAQALRRAIQRARAEGKEVICMLNGGTNLGYYLASGGSRVVLSPQGQLLVSGLRAEAVFAKGLLDKLGIQADIVQAGRYKGAAEGLTRSTPSDAFTEAMEGLIGDVFENYVADLARDRGLSRRKVRRLLAEGPYTAQDARKAGLVDDVMHYDELVAGLAADGDKVQVDTEYAVQRRRQGGGVSLLNLLMGGGRSGAPARQGPAVAVLYAVGPIVLGGSGDMGLGDQVVDATIMRTIIRELADDESIVGVVVRVDSPGGSALASDLIWRELRLLDGVKPVVASFSDTAASGGYYIGAGARRILAEPGTLTGSIGVFGGKLVLTGLFDKIGLNVAVFEAGEGGGLLSPFESLDEEGRRRFQNMVDDTYGIFLERVASTRPGMGKDAVHRVAQGRVWTGSQALERGLVDELGDLRAAIRLVKKEAGLDPDAEMDVVRLPRSRNLIQAIMSGGELSTEGRVMQALPEAVRAMEFLRVYLRAVLALQHERALCLTPAAVRVR